MPKVAVYSNACWKPFRMISLCTMRIRCRRLSRDASIALLVKSTRETRVLGRKSAVYLRSSRTLYTDRITTKCKKAREDDYTISDAMSSELKLLCIWHFKKLRSVLLEVFPQVYMADSQTSPGRIYTFFKIKTVFLPFMSDERGEWECTKIDIFLGKEKELLTWTDFNCEKENCFSPQKKT